MAAGGPGSEIYHDDDSEIVPDKVYDNVLDDVHMHLDDFLRSEMFKPLVEPHTKSAAKK
jgi:hypothetical protein